MKDAQDIIPDQAVGTVVIVGGGHAAGELATGLREQGWGGQIVVVGDEAHLPYQRPPLSKAFLDGKVAIEGLLLKPLATYEKAHVEFIRGVRVDVIDREARAVHLSDGRSLSYTKLAIATGGRVRALPGEDAERAVAAPNFHYLRTVDDALRIRESLIAGARLVVVGGGYVGLEVAATAVAHGLQVTVVEAAPRLLARVTSPEMSAFFEETHRRAGVDVRTGTLVRGFEFDGERISAVLCGDGASIPADFVVVGVGLLPNVELAAAAGLEVDNGIIVDELCRTSDPDIVALGDCCNHPNPVVGRRIRLESVPNAVEQARTAAATLCGRERPYHMVPWFWSDQYGIKLKSVGLCEGYDRVVVRGVIGAPAFSVFYMNGEYVVAADIVNRPPELLIAKRLVGERPVVDPATLADESVPLIKLLPAAKSG
ncbi:MAG: pyridine nucleotide-disulfide oxidoreductase [Betaproteobacteria bacterium HGW-Betaproteobacteria-4]|jgi:3-phenylpropionate/trans-cinnamate dioxygenase ferredoxin reductase subunit|nr:MAG: pyridine nucleotide-disulfide oxidoreductase [Betaproteobacteria bacterium HGW-Betaproteobacteria-4]